METIIHHGRNIRRFRKMLEIKQDSLAREIGVSQSRLSELESYSKIDDGLLEKTAKALNVPVALLKNLPDNGFAQHIYNNTFEKIENLSFGNEDFNKNNSYSTYNMFDELDKINLLQDLKISELGKKLNKKNDKSAHDE